MWRIKRSKRRSRSRRKRKRKRERKRLHPAGKPLPLRLAGWMQEGMARLKTGILDKLTALDRQLSNRQRKAIFCVVVLLWTGTLFYISATAVWKPQAAFGQQFIPERVSGRSAHKTVLPVGTDRGRPRSTAGDFTDSGYLRLKILKHETKRAAERGN